MKRDVGDAAYQDQVGVGGECISMCGIAGEVRGKPSRGQHRIENVLEGLAHRGPDQSGLYDSAYATLGAVRLGIVDLAGGAQPVICQNPKTVVVFNGEIYNHAELRKELVQRGRKYVTNCDTETVMHAFLEWGADCFIRFHGMFAIAIWDENERRLLLARDRMGIKPLYYSVARSQLYFGSELKALFARGAVSRNIDLSALQDYLSLNYVPGPATLVEGVKKVPPGSWMEWKDGVLRTELYWSLESRPAQHVHLADATEQLDELLKRSVREHLTGDVPVSVWASGGLDSSAIVHYASALCDKPIRTFSVTFAGRSFDEAKDSRLLAEHYGTLHEHMDINPSLELSNALENMSYYSDEPNADAGALPLWFLSQMTGATVKVALSGEGADELFAGYQTYAADRWKRRLARLPGFVTRWMQGLARLLPVSDEKIGFDYKVCRFLAGLPLSAAHAHFSWNGTFSEAEKQMFYRPYRAGAAHAFLEPHGWDNSQRDWLARALLADQRFYLTDNILAKCDRMSMAHSVEVRPPFLDHRIVEFANGLPSAMKLHRGVSKVILRSLLKDKLPSALLRKKKEGLDIPVHHWLRTALRPLVLDTMSSEAVQRSGLFDTGFISRLLADHMAYRRNAGYHLWGLLTLALWIQRWDIKCDAARNVEPVLAHSQLAAILDGA